MWLERAWYFFIDGFVPLLSHNNACQFLEFSIIPSAILEIPTFHCFLVTCTCRRKNFGGKDVFSRSTLVAFIKCTTIKGFHRGLCRHTAASNVYLLSFCHHSDHHVSRTCLACIQVKTFPASWPVSVKHLLTLYWFRGLHFVSGFINMISGYFGVLGEPCIKRKVSCASA